MSLFASFDFADLVLLVVKFAFINKILISPHNVISCTIDLHFLGNATSMRVSFLLSCSELQIAIDYTVLVQHQLTRRLYIWAMDPGMGVGRVTFVLNVSMSTNIYFFRNNKSGHSDRYLFYQNIFGFENLH